MTVGDRLRRVREIQGVSLRTLAERAGLNVATLWRLEHNAVSPTITTLERIARALHVPFAALVVPAPRLRNTEDVMATKADLEDRVAELEEQIQDIEEELTDLEDDLEEAEACGTCGEDPCICETDDLDPDDDAPEEDD